MQNAIKYTYYVILIVFIATATLSLLGLAYIWFQHPIDGDGKLRNLPYLGTLVTTLIVEAIAVVFAFVKSGLRYLPRVVSYKTEKETFKFMCEYIKQGTSVTIVSNRLTLLTRSNDFYNGVLREAQSGKRFEIITPRPIDGNIRNTLGQAGVVFIVTSENASPEARFTLINGERAGAERLAIARGTHPEHEVTIFDSNSGPQMIALAKDIIRKSKNIANAA